jgi:hypothetical protein
VNVQQKEGYNIFSVTNPIKEDLSRIDLAEDIELAYVFDQSLGVKDRVSGFLGNLLQGIALVGVIIFLALGVRSASIVMMAIPLSILMGLWVVGNLDFALQQMSIAGLVVALGLLVDNSIAIIENIERFSRTGLFQQGSGHQRYRAIGLTDHQCYADHHSGIHTDHFDARNNRRFYPSLTCYRYDDIDGLSDHCRYPDASFGQLDFEEKKENGGAQGADLI